MKRVVMEKGCSAGSLVNSYIGSHTRDDWRENPNWGTSRQTFIRLITCFLQIQCH